MKKPQYAIAMELRQNDKQLNESFFKLPDRLQWEWLRFACHNKPDKAIKYCKKLIETNAR